MPKSKSALAEPGTSRTRTTRIYEKKRTHAEHTPAISESTPALMPESTPESSPESPPEPEQEHRHPVVLAPRSMAHIPLGEHRPIHSQPIPE